MILRLLLVLAILFPNWGHGHEVRSGSFADTLARTVSPKVRRIDRKLGAIESDLEQLPRVSDPLPGRRYGFHSKPLEREDEPAWIQLDLGRKFKVDQLVMVPADIPVRAVEAYLFPRRFKVEVSDDRDFKESVVIVDESAQDYPDPGRNPLLFEGGEEEGRYVRFTSLKHQRIKSGKYAWALGEIMVLSGNYNVAVSVPSEASNNGLRWPPNWRLGNINDGLSMLGLPEGGPESPSDGYHSRRYKVDDTRKLVTIDLGAEYPIDEVRLLPAWPRQFLDAPGLGVPHRMNIWVSPDAQIDEGDANLFPFEDVSKTWYNPLTVRCAGEGAMGRYVQVEALELGGHNQKFELALSEIQVFSAGENVALGKRVAVSDPQKEKDGPRWRKEFLVDGYSSRSRLINWPEYLGSLTKRRRLERTRSRLQEKRDTTAREVADRTIVAGSGLCAITVLALFAVLARQRSLRHRDRIRLREQIARDLHDELGSNLGTISLLSELGSRERELSSEIREDFEEIHRTAERSADAMRDIVWLIDWGTASLLDLVSKMREAAEHLIGESVQLQVTPEEVAEIDLALEFRRHVLFAFKESLNNVRRHAQASKVAVTITCSHDTILFEITDDGIGFQVDEQRQIGHGLENLIRRAARLDGHCVIESTPGKGSTVRFEVPFKTRINR